MARDEIIIELGKRNGGDILFEPTMGMYRGRITQAGIGPNNQSRTGIARRLPTIPGMCVALDIDGKTGRIFDPLSLKEKSDTLEDIANLVKGQSSAVVTNSEPKPEREQIRKLNDSEVATWHFWMQRIVEEEHHAILRQGRFVDQAKLPGRIRLDFISDHRAGPVYKDEFDRLEQGTYIWPGQPGFQDQQQQLQGGAVAK